MRIKDETTTPVSDVTTVEKKRKKGPYIQVPVIISICIVVLSVLAYLGYSMFLLKEPEGVLWSVESDDATYYFEFGNDDTYTAYVGSIVVSGSYKKWKESSGNIFYFDSNIGGFDNQQYATYTISGSRILGNQEFTVSYGDGSEFTLKQTAERKDYLEIPENFEPDEELVGAWEVTYFGSPVYRATFNEDGTMKMERLYDNTVFNGTYTIEDGSINFTYYLSDYIVYPSKYEIKGDILYFMDMPFQRVGTVATADEALLMD